MFSSILLVLSFLQQLMASFSVPLIVPSYIRESRCMNPKSVPLFVHPTIATKSTRRAQPFRRHESFHQQEMSICSKVPSISKALSSTMPWTIRLSLAVLWVCMPLISLIIRSPLIYFRVCVGCSIQLTSLMAASTTPLHTESTLWTGAGSSDYTEKPLISISDQVRSLLIFALHQAQPGSLRTLIPIKSAATTWKRAD